MTTPGAPAQPSSLSKRAARRLIQRAFVLAGRDPRAHAAIRNARLTTLWVLKDWNLEWSVVVERGKAAYDRRPARQPDLALVWPSAEDFFAEAEDGFREARHPILRQNTEAARFLVPLARAFFQALRRVLQFPVDDDGTRLA